MERKNFIAFVCGMRASGKSFLLAKYAAKFSRRIVLDPNCEFLGAYSGARECHTLAQTIDALDDLSGERRWTVVTCIDPEQVPRLCRVLAPVGGMGGYARAVGGLLVECGEVDVIAPNHAGISAEVRNLFQRGRHYRVSVVCATQRPRDVHRVVTAQADAVCAFRQHEPRDLDYLAQCTSVAIAARVRTLDQYWHIQYLPNHGAAFAVNPRGVAVEKIDPFSGESANNAVNDSEALA
jgi:hypothetical protein